MCVVDILAHMRFFRYDGFIAHRYSDLGREAEGAEGATARDSIPRRKYQPSVLSAHHRDAPLLLYLRSCGTPELYPGGHLHQYLLVSFRIDGNRVCESHSFVGLSIPINVHMYILSFSFHRFNVMRTPLIYLPITLLQLANAFVSLRRLTAFLLAEERVEYVEPLEKPGIEIQGANFYWAEPPEDVAPQLAADRGRKEEAPSNGKKRKHSRGSWLRRKHGMKGTYKAEDHNAVGGPADPADLRVRPEDVADEKDMEHEKENDALPETHKAAADLSNFWLHDVNVMVSVLSFF